MMVVLLRPASIALAAGIISAQWLVASGFTPRIPVGARLPTMHDTNIVLHASEVVSDSETASASKKLPSKGSNTKKKHPKQKESQKRMKMTLTLANGNSKTNGKRSAKQTNGKKPSQRANGQKRRGRPRSKKQGRKPLKPLSDLVLGSKIDGVVAGLSDFGAFIKTDYAIKQENDPRPGSGYALLHKSQIQDDKIEDLSSVLRVGDQIKGARVTSIKYAKGEVGLSLRKQRPKRRALNEVNVGDELDGKVASVMSYGVFVDIGAKKNALLHISRITQDKVTNIRDHLNEGDWVTVHIIEKDTEKKTLACSMLDQNADDYLDHRQRRLKKRMLEEEATDGKEFVEKTELEFFEDAIRELEDAFK